VTLTDARRHGDLTQHVHWLAPGKRIPHDDRLDLDELTGWIAERHRAGTGVALDCVTASQLVVTLAALRSAGTRPDDRIEHAAVVPVDAVAELAALGVLVVTPTGTSSPNAGTTTSPTSNRPISPRCGGWRRYWPAGPGRAVHRPAVGGADPWASMRAAVHRRTPSGSVLSPTKGSRPQRH
jgi:predicted amidohydrolase YtcJ